MRADRRWLAVFAAVALAAAAGNFQPLRAGSMQLQEWSSIVGAEFGAVEIAGPAADPDWVPDPVRLPFVTAGSYLAAVDELGSPALSPAGITRVNGFHRQVADTTLLQGLRVAPQADGAAGGAAPTEDPPPPRDPHARPGRSTAEGPCLVLQPAAAGATVDATVPAGGVVLETRNEPVQLWLRSFGIYFVEEPFATVPAGRSVTLAPPARPGIVWHVRAASTGGAALCSRAP
jgi:hypothetical protein